MHRYLNLSQYLFLGQAGRCTGSKHSLTISASSAPAHSADPGVIARMPHLSPPGEWYPCKTASVAEEITSGLDTYPPKHLSVAHSSVKEFSRDVATCRNEHFILLRVCALLLGQTWTEL